MKKEFKVISIVGARPQLIKAATLSRALNQSSTIQEIILHTGQHYDDQMSNIFFEELGLSSPQYNLQIRSNRHGEMTGKMIQAIEEIFINEMPHGVIIYGDTNSTLAGAIAASKLHIPLIHVEAGLRSYNSKMPEEINRKLSDHLSSLLLCPTQQAVKNLNLEGIQDGVYHIGDVMYDATLYASDKIMSHKKILDSLGIEPKKYILTTLHRAENTESIEKLTSLFDYINDFAHQEDVCAILPVHPRIKIKWQNLKNNYKNIICCEPLGYFDIQTLLHYAKYIMTDSGGLQKEAYFHRIPCITLRGETEWVETIEAGWNRLWQVPEYTLPLQEITDYGVGDSAHQIKNLIERFFEKR